MGQSLAVPDQSGQCSEEHHTKRSGTNEFKPWPPEQNQRANFSDARGIHELSRIAPAIPIRRHGTPEFLYRGAREDQADQQLQDHCCFFPGAIGACGPPGLPPRAFSCSSWYTRSLSATCSVVRITGLGGFS